MRPAPRIWPIGPSPRTPSTLSFQSSLVDQPSHPLQPKGPRIHRGFRRADRHFLAERTDCNDLDHWPGSSLAGGSKRMPPSAAYAIGSPAASSHFQPSDLAKRVRRIVCTGLLASRSRGRRGFRVRGLHAGIVAARRLAKRVAIGSLHAGTRHRAPLRNVSGARGSAILNRYFRRGLRHRRGLRRRLGHAVGRGGDARLAALRPAAFHDEVASSLVLGSAAIEDAPPPDVSAISCGPSSVASSGIG